MIAITEKRKRSAFFIQRSVIFALFLRELKTRFETPAHYFYAVMDPLIQVLLFSTIFLVLGRKSRLEGVPFTLFLLTGIVPWFFFRAVVNRSMAVLRSNMGLFFYRQVKPIDTIIASILLELLIYCAVFFILLAIFFGVFENSIAVENPGKLITVYVVFVVFSLAVALNLMVVNFHYPVVGRVFRVLIRVLYFTSGILFPVSMIPAQLRKYLLYNPIAHVMEISRDAYFIAYESDYGDWRFLLLSTLGLLVLGLALYRLNRFALLNPST